MSEESEIFYVVLCLKESLDVNGMETKISKENGFAGYLPVFRTYKYAEKFSKGKFNVVAIALKKKGGRCEQAPYQSRGKGGRG